MPKDVDFKGSGMKGFGFEEKGYQERNLKTLLGTLSKKGTQKAISDLSKIERDEWVSMATVSKDIATVAKAGGLREIVGGSIDRIYDVINDQIDALTSELTNTVTGAINELLAPFIADYLIPLINDLTAFLSENMTGAGVGGILGGVAAFWLPGGAAWVAVGAILGAALESLVNWSRGLVPQDEQMTGSPAGYITWAEANRDGIRYPTYQEYLDWIASENQRFIDEHTVDEWDDSLWRR